MQKSEKKETSSGTVQQRSAYAGYARNAMHLQAHSFRRNHFPLPVSLCPSARCLLLEIPYFFTENIPSGYDYHVRTVFQAETRKYRRNTEKCGAFFPGSRAFRPLSRSSGETLGAAGEISCPERFRPLSDENFSARKVRELRASPSRRKNAHAFFVSLIFINHESSGHFPRGDALYRRLSKLRFSSFSGWNRRRGRFRLRRPAYAAGSRKGQRPLTPRKMQRIFPFFGQDTILRRPAYAAGSRKGQRPLTPRKMQRIFPSLNESRFPERR